MTPSSVIIAAPKTPCVRCAKMHDTPAAFLMACMKCERAWHHTCHIPPVTESEIRARMDADNVGKRDAGLLAWQCRRCTKRLRVERPSDNITPSASSSLGVRENPNAARPGSLINEGATRAPALTMSQASSLPTTRDAPTIVDDDVIMLDDEVEEVPRSTAESSAVRHPVNRPTVVPGVPQLQTQKSTGSPVERTTNTTVVKTITQQGTQHIPSQQNDVHITFQKRIAPRNTQRFIIQRLPPEPRHNPQPTHTTLPPRSQAGPSSLHPVADPQNDAIPGPSSPEPTQAPPSPKATISSSDIRALITRMRDEGQLAPPPAIDYVFTVRPRKLDATRGPSPILSAKAKGKQRALPPPASDTRSPTRDLDAVERKLNDFRDVDVDPASVSASDSDSDGRGGERRSAGPLARTPSPDHEADPHNIDDMYGSVAPRFRSRQPAQANRRSEPAAPHETRLLWMVREDGDSSEEGRKGEEMDELGRILKKKARIQERREGEPRPLRPRKAPARRLVGRALRKKQAEATNLYVPA